MLLALGVAGTIEPVIQAASGTGAGADPANTNLIQNGSFESPSVPSGSFTTFFGAGNGAEPDPNGITDWTVGDVSVDLVDTGYFQAEDGSQSVDLEGSPGPGAVSQTIATTAGDTYTLSWWGAANPYCGPNTYTMDVYWNGSLVDSPAFTTGTAAAMGWVEEQITVTASSSSTTVAFASPPASVTVPSLDCGATLDNVSLVPAASTVSATLSTASPTVAGVETVPASVVPTSDVDGTSGGSGDAASAPLDSIPLDSIGLASSPLDSIPLDSIPLDSIAVPSGGNSAIAADQQALESALLSDIGITYPAGCSGSACTGWAGVLVGTPYADVPLESVTLADVLTNPTAAQNFNTVDLGDLDLASSPLDSIPLDSIELGSTPLDSIDLPGATSGAAGALAAWCTELTSLGFNCLSFGINASGGDDNGVTLLSLALAGVPLDSIPLDSIPLDSISLSSSPLDSIPLDSINLEANPLDSIPLDSIPLDSIPLDSIPLDSIGNLSTVCVSNSSFSCGMADATLGQAYSADAIPATATLADLSSYDGTTIGELLTGDNTSATGYPALTLADLILSTVPPASYPWQAVSLPTLPLASAETAGGAVSYTATLQVTGAPATVQVSVNLPTGFAYVAGSSALGSSHVADPTGTSTLGWTLSLPTGTSTLSFQANAGIGLGPATATVSAAIGGDVESSATATVEVIDGEAPEINSASPAFPLVPGTPPANDGNLNIGYLTYQGDLNDWSVTVPQNDELTIALTNLPATYDLELFGPASQQLQGTPTEDLPGVTDTLPSTSPEGTTEATPGSQDLPITPPAGDQLEAVSNNPDSQSQYIQTPPLAAGTYTIQVSGYNGAFSTQPYLLQANLLGGETAPSCAAAGTSSGSGIVYPNTLADAANGPATIPSGYTTITPGDSQVPTGLNTLFILDTQRLGAAFGSDETTILNDIQAVDTDAGAGVVGAIVPVDAYQSVQNAYAQWNGDPCSVALADDVVAAISAVIDQIRSAYPSVQNLVIVGADDQIPFARVADGSSQSNERDYGSATFAGENNVEGDALSLGYYFSDDPYAADSPLGVGSTTLYLPQLAIGRLVESAAEIESALTRFTNSNGDLNATSSLTTGYSFLSSGAQAVEANLASDGLKSTSACDLISGSWTEADLDTALAGTASCPLPGVDSINAHFDYSRALPGYDNTNNVTSPLFTTTDVSSPSPATSFAGRLLFSMGCHSGLDIDDAEVAPSGVHTPVVDWATTFADAGALWVANTGYGYADTDTIAYSAKLMADFAANLNGTLTIGEALTAAKQQYAAGNAIISPYDLKALMESTFYGLPFYNLNKPGTPVPPAQGGATETDPTLPTGLSVLPVSLSPQNTEVKTANGDYYEDGSGGTQTTEYRPIEPLATVPVTETNLVPHGALITGLGSNDVTSFTPAYSLPATGAADSTPPTIGDAAFPGTLQRVASYGTFTPTGTGQGADLDLVTGQFFPNPSSPGSGTQRLFSSISAQVYYLPPTSPLASDYTPPTIDSSDASSTSSGISFDVQVTPAGAPVDGVIVLYTDAGSPGTWHSLSLSSGNGGQSWTGDAGATPSGQVQYLVEAVDAAGNVAVSNNEGTDFNGAPAPSISITLSGAGPTNGYYTSTSVTADITAPAGSSYVLDNGTSTPVPAGGQVVVTGNGEHTLTVTAPGGATDTQMFAISTAETTTSLTSSANPSVVGQAVTYTATVTPVTSGVGTPTGHVEFFDGGVPISSCGAASGEELGAGASAQCPVTYSSSSTLPHTISAQYLGDSNFTGSTSTLPLTQVVDQALTSTSLSSSPTSAVVGESVTYTASVAVTSPGAGTPTGAVEFLDAGSAISSCGGVKGEPLGGGGNAVCTITYGAVAAHPITATYLGDINFASSTTSPALSEPVGQAATTTSLASSVSPSVVGQSVTYTASVSVNAPGAGSPTGSVAFYDGGSPISCASTATETLSGGSASCTVTYAASGPHTISATYSGDSNFAGSNTSPLTQTVDQAATTTSLASSVSPSVVGQSVTYKASVSVNAPGAGSPTGNVEFLDTGTAISGCGGSGGVSLSSGTAVCKVAYGSTGSHTITAKYLGTANFAASTTASALTQVVGQAETTTSLSLSSSVAIYGTEQAVVFTASVAPQYPGTPTGTVTVESGSTALCTIKLPASTCSASAKALAAAVSPYPLTAVYGGDANFTGSTSGPVSLYVFTQSCISTTVNGSVNVSNGQIICIGSGGKINGAVTVASGGALVVTSGTITGALSSTGGALGVVVCGSSIGGAVSVSGAAGPVWLGGPLLCPGNTLTGAVTLTGNTGGISFEANHLTGALDIANNGGGVLVTGNSETGNATVTTNTGGVAFTKNSIVGSLVITNNSGGFLFSGNTITGSVTNTGNH